MVLLGALERVEYHGGPGFLLKGGVAIELRLRMKARATKDVDVVFRGSRDQLLEALDDAFAHPYADFTYLRGEPEDHGPHALRFDVKLAYQTRAWATVRLEVSQAEIGTDEIELVPAIGLEDFALAGPDEVACLPLRYQIAQKLHAVTERPERRENVRFRDLVDLAILRELIEDHSAVRRACEETFEHRGTHSWPPDLVAPAAWADGYRALATELGLDVVDVDAAAEQVRDLIDELISA